MTINATEMDYLTDSDSKHWQYGQAPGTKVDALVKTFGKNLLNL